MLEAIREPRYHEVCGYIYKGMRNKEIANCMGISEKTVKNYLNQIYRKVDVSGRKQLREKIEKEIYKNATRRPFHSMLGAPNGR